MSEEKKIIQAQTFQVVDEQGQIRATFGMNAEDSPCLEILRQDGTKGISVAIPNSGHVNNLWQGRESPLLEMYDDKGTVRVRILLYDESPQYPSICLLDSEGKERIFLTVTPDDDVQAFALDTIEGHQYIAGTR